MYVCIEVALCGVYMRSAVQLSLGGGASKVGQCPIPAGTTIGPALSMRTCTMCVLSVAKFTLGLS